MSFAFKRGLGPRISSPMGPKNHKWLRFFLLGAKNSDFGQYIHQCSTPRSVGSRSSRRGRCTPSVQVKTRPRQYFQHFSALENVQMGDTCCTWFLQKCKMRVNTRPSTTQLRPFCLGRPSIKSQFSHTCKHLAPHAAVRTQTCVIGPSAESLLALVQPRRVSAAGPITAELNC